MFSKIASWIRKDDAIRQQAKEIERAFEKPDEVLDLEVLKKGMEDVTKKEQQATEILAKLEIPWLVSSSGPVVPATRLVEILKDEEKLKKLVSMMRMKAFW